MIVSCPDCNKEVSSQAISCPGCGYPIKEGVMKNQVPCTPKEAPDVEDSKTERKTILG